MISEARWLRPLINDRVVVPLASWKFTCINKDINLSTTGSNLLNDKCKDLLSE